MIAFVLIAALLFCVGETFAQADAVPEPQDLIVSVNPVRLDQTHGAVQLSVFSQKGMSYTLGLLLFIPAAEDEKKSRRIGVLFSLLSAPSHQLGAMSHCGVSEEVGGVKGAWRGICVILRVSKPGLTVSLLQVPTHTLDELKELGIDTVLAFIRSDEPRHKFVFRRSIPLADFRDIPPLVGRDEPSDRQKPTGEDMGI